MRKELGYKRVLNLFILIIFIGTLFFMFSEQSWAESKRFTSPPASKEHWNVFCNKTGRNVVLGIHRPNNNHILMAGPFNNEPQARDWVNSNCSSWRCDLNGRCVTGRDTQAPCPPGTYRDSGAFGQGSGKCLPIRR
jgi:hypothetical protein